MSTGWSILGRACAALSLGLVVYLASAFWGAPAGARQCFWNGTAPICRGQCPRGYERVEVSMAGCINGYKVRCCEPLRSTTSHGGNTSTETWRIRSLYPYRVQIKFYSRTRNVTWPGPNRAFTLNDSKYHNFSLSCRVGEQICYGAWNVETGGKTGTRYWGVGQGGRQGCANCCWTCGRAGNPRSITLQR